MERIQRILRHDTFNHYLQRIRTLEQGRPFCLHPIEHSIDVARIAYILWLEHVIEEGKFALSSNAAICSDVKCQIYGAALLHDIGRYRQYLYGENHAEVSAQLAKEIVIDVGYSDDEQKVILDAIQFHNEDSSENIVTRLLQQADRLSRTCYQCKEQVRCYKIDKMETKQGLIY